MNGNRGEYVALIGMLLERKKSWSEIASEVAAAGSAIAVRYRLHQPTLFAAGDDSGSLDEAERLLNSWESRSLDFVTVLDADYPRRLLGVRDAPPILFYEGAISSHDDGMSIIGSRAASPMGLRHAYEIAMMLVERNLSVISGLAGGIDAAAHRAALDFGGRTVAVIGTGITKAYPVENRLLQQEICQRGLVLSQFMPDAAPTMKTFPMRNATMSGYGLASIVVEAGEHSGTRIQARKSIEQGRPVVLLRSVVESTSWGTALVGRPGVYVVSSPRELYDAIAEIRQASSTVDEIPSALVEPVLG